MTDGCDQPEGLRAREGEWGVRGKVLGRISVRGWPVEQLRREGWGLTWWSSD